MAEMNDKIQNIAMENKQLINKVQSVETNFHRVSFTYIYMDTNIRRRVVNGCSNIQTFSKYFLKM